MLIDLKTPVSDLQRYLFTKGWLQENEQLLRTEKPGEGNMNVVIRIHSNLRTFILKLSRPFVQKYQEVKAPIERVDVEYEFYRTISSDTLKTHLPEALAFDKNNHVLMLEDLGLCDDMTFIYETKKVAHTTIGKLVDILKELHKTPITKDFPDNYELRKLNHQHIFVLPFLTDNGFSLNEVQDGLQALSEPFKTNENLKKVIGDIGEKYLSSGQILLHGDYYPGSWMTNNDRIHIIDPEFCFAGFAEFDVGVMSAHIIMATMNFEYLESICDLYGTGLKYNLVKKITAIEIMRRMIGLAQLPITRRLDEKKYLLDVAQKLIIS